MHDAGVDDVHEVGDVTDVGFDAEFLDRGLDVRQQSFAVGTAGTENFDFHNSMLL